MRLLLKIKRLFRYFLSFSTTIGIVEKPRNKKDGISLLVRLKDEADWIRYSLFSIKNFADEIIVGDNGSKDNSVEIVERLIKEGLNIKFYQCPEMRINELTNFLLKKARYRWVMKWDADFVARTTGKYSIDSLRKKLLNMDYNRYYLILISHICLAGDLFHQDPKELTHTEEYIYTNSDHLKFIHPETCESLKTPKYYAVVRIDGHYAFHVDVKSAERMLNRKYWFEWMKLKDYEKYPTIDSYVEYCVKSEKRFANIQEAKIDNVIQYCKRLIPYNNKLFGEYPELLDESLMNPKYKVIYKNGKIIGRNDVFI